MTALIDEVMASTARSLDAIQRSGTRSPLAQMLLVALEREQVVTVVYSEDEIDDRIAALPVESELREIIQRAILWVQRDEELHAQYIRGLLLRSKSPMPVAFVLGRQLVGAVGGWASAVSLRNRSTAFGLRRAVARSMMAAGKLAGRVPPAVVDELGQRGFRRFCALNTALEQSAIASYERLMPLLTEASERAAFERILTDEHRHRALFDVLTDVFDDDDHLVGGVSFNDVVERLAAITPWFLPAGMRPTAGSRSRFGQGAITHVARGAADELSAAVLESLTAAGLPQIIASRGGLVAIRTSFMLGYDRRDRSHVITPEVLDIIAAAARGWGANDVAVLETPTVYDRYFGGRSVHQVAAYLGVESDHYRLVDVAGDLRKADFERGLAATTISATWADASVRMVVSKLCGDPTELAHLSLATLGGIGGRVDESQVYTNRLVDHRTATLMALDIAPPDFAVVDAWGAVADGPVGVMGCARPSVQHRIYAGADALGVDAAVLCDLGFPDPLASRFIKHADRWFGSTSPTTTVTGAPGPFKGFRAPQGSLWYRLVSATAAPVYFHLSRNGSLFVPAMDERAFPPTGRVGWPTRLVRRAAQRVFGLHPPP